MSRRPYFERGIIKDDLFANATYNEGYAKHCHMYECFGMDGRCDWFRWQCRECDRKYLSLRSEKRMKYYKCHDCDSLHFVYKGFFNHDQTPTVPLKPSEVTVDLYRAETTESEYGSRSEFYGSLDYIAEKDDSDYFDIERVWLVTEDEQLLLAEGDIDFDRLKDAPVQ